MLPSCHALDLMFLDDEIEVEFVTGLKMLHTSNSRCSMTWTKMKEMFTYDTSFLNLKKVVIDGDVESNPGPVDNIVETPKVKVDPRNVQKDLEDV